jgi:fermentation-respiration switch protein FrsA (DUF1100 family)
MHQAPARSIIYISRYRPLDYVASISTPVLMIAANNDTLCPISAVNEAEKLLSNGEVTISPPSTLSSRTLVAMVLICSTSHHQVIKYDVGHFDFYEGKPHFAETLDQQIRFFHKHL